MFKRAGHDIKGPIRIKKRNRRKACNLMDDVMVTIGVSYGTLDSYKRKTLNDGLKLSSGHCMLLNQFESLEIELDPTNYWHLLTSTDIYWHLLTRLSSGDSGDIPGSVVPAWEIGMACCLQEECHFCKGLRFRSHSMSSHFHPAKPCHHHKWYIPSCCQFPFSHSQTCTAHKYHSQCPRLRNQHSNLPRSSGW